MEQKVEIDRIVQRYREPRYGSVDKMGLGDLFDRQDPKFLERYIEILREYDWPLPTYNPPNKTGHIVCVQGKSPSTLYTAMDEALNKTTGPYLVFGILLRAGYRVGFYKWERDDDGNVTKLACKNVYSFAWPKEVLRYIEPAISCMLRTVKPYPGAPLVDMVIADKSKEELLPLKPDWPPYVFM